MPVPDRDRASRRKVKGDLPHRHDRHPHHLGGDVRTALALEQPLGLLEREGLVEEHHRVRGVLQIDQPRRSPVRCHHLVDLGTGRRELHCPAVLICRQPGGTVRVAVTLDLVVQGVHERRAGHERAVDRLVDQADRVEDALDPVGPQRQAIQIQVGPRVLGQRRPVVVNRVEDRARGLLHRLLVSQ